MNGRRLCAGLCSAILGLEEGASQTFDLQAFSSQVTPTVDISRFDSANVMVPGSYAVDIVVNGMRLGRRIIEFKRVEGFNDTQPCVDEKVLAWLPIAPHALTPAARDPQCTTLEQWLPLASAGMNISTLQWTVSLPQAYLKQVARGTVDPINWDDGIDAALMTYTFSASNRLSGRGEGRRYLGVASGLNIGSWRLRHQGSQSWSSHTGLQRYQNTATYLQRSIIPWQTQLTLGDSFSSGNLLEGIRLRGIGLATDERMPAQSRQGYAPQVRGVADSNATVTIRQNGYTLYETTVAPGPFVIDDLYPTGYGGDLTVSVTEVDGRRNTFVVPWSVAPQLLRTGTHRYSLNVGRARQYRRTREGPLVWQGTLAQGVSNHLTLYGGSSLTQGHTLGKLGFALGTPLGAFSLDRSESRTRLPGQGVVSGHSLGLGFSKNLPVSGTYFALGAYRFSSEGYRGIHDAVNHYGLADVPRQKNRIDFTLNQRLGEGTLSLFGSSVDYWRRQHGRQTSFTLSYGAHWRKLAWNLSAQRSRVEDTRITLSDSERNEAAYWGRSGLPGRLDNRVLLTLSMPLGAALRSPSVYTSLSRDRGTHRGSQQQVGVSGLLGEEGAVSYGISSSRYRSEHQTDNTLNAYAGMRTGIANLRAGYGRAPGSSQLSFNADGSLIVHGGGMTLSQPLGEASVVVQAPGAEGAQLASGVRINRKGYAVVPSLRAFQNNVVTLDPQGMAMDVELGESSRNVVPTLGAVSRVAFTTLSGRAVVLKARHESGRPLPFAAQVFDEHGREVGVVGQASKAFVRGIGEQGRLTVQWSEGAGGRCFIDYRLPPRPVDQRQSRADLVQGRCASTPSKDDSQ